MVGLEDIFESRLEQINVIFDSYSTLHEVYLAVLKSGANAKTQMFEKAKKSADNKQEELSTRLYTQSFILMVGQAEALLKDIFEDLILENFTKMKKLNDSDLSFSLKTIQQIFEKSESDELAVYEFAERLVSKINDSRNKTEKINFQNIKSVADNYKRFFNIDIDVNADYCRSINVIFNKRHVLVHLNGRVDKRFVNNAKKSNYIVEKEGDFIEIKKNFYKQSVSDFKKLFNKIDEEILRLKYNREGVGSVKKTGQ